MSNKLINLTSFIVNVVGLSVSITQISKASDEFQCINAVQSFSNSKQMASGDFSANVQWKDIFLNSQSIGYGPGEDRFYELTIVDGKVYMARPGEKKDVIVRTTPQPNEGAAMLQVISPNKWKKSVTLSAIGSFDDLNFEMDQVIDDIECNDDVLIPFKIIGYASSVTWSMDTLPSRVINTNDQDVVIIGIYNRNNKSKYFMVRGYNIHAHVLIPSLSYAGHLRTIKLNEGAQLFFPQRD